MKEFLYLFLFLAFFSILQSKDNNTINIIQKNGEILSLDIDSLETLNFENYSNTAELVIYLKDTSFIRFKTFHISNIKISKGFYDIDSLLIVYNTAIDFFGYFVKSTISIPINSILSISIPNFNELKNTVYTKMKIEISNLMAKYKSEETPRLFSKSFSINNGKDDNNLKTYRNLEAHCEGCYFHIFTGDFHFCYSSGNHDSNNDEYCSYRYSVLYVDTIMQVIDSLKYVSQDKNYDVANAGGGWRNESDYDETLTLYSIPYSIDDEGNIVCETIITDLSKIIYSFKYFNITGSSGGHTSSSTVFSNFLTPTDSSRIKIQLTQ